MLDGPCLVLLVGFPQCRAVVMGFSSLALLPSHPLPLWLGLVYSPNLDQVQIRRL